MVHRNQYAIVQRNSEEYGRAMSNKGLVGVHEFGDFVILCGESLPVAIGEGKDISVALIGRAFDSFDRLTSEQDIVNSITSSKCTDICSIFDLLSPIFGRYCVFVKLSSEYFVLGDAAHLKQIFYEIPVTDSGVSFITSSMQLYWTLTDTELKPVAEAAHILNSASFRSKEYTWYGTQLPDRRLSRQLPNTYLRISDGKTYRLPLQVDTKLKLTYDQIIHKASRILKCSFDNMARKSHIIQPLTGGLDSRTLFAASLKHKENIEYYTFRTHDTPTDDVEIPSVIAKDFALRFSFFKPERLSENFSALMSEHDFFRRKLSKLGFVQFHYNRNYSHRVINVNGNVAEVARCFYGVEHGRASTFTLALFSGYGKNFSLFYNEIKAWRDCALRFGVDGISLVDLFYWEQKMPSWGAQFPFEQDVAIEEISPFNNRELLLLLLSVPSKKRKGPDFKVFTDIINELEPGLLKIPVNPRESKIKLRIKSNYFFQFSFRLSIYYLRQLRGCLRRNSS